MPFAAGQVITNKGAAILAGRNVGSTPSQTELKYIGFGTGATGAARTAAVGDTQLSGEVETRATGTGSVITQSVTNDTYQVVGTCMATTSRAIDEMGVFDASSNGNMGVSVTHAVQNLGNGDSIQYTVKIRFVAN